ncbi:MAG: DUF4252 domain-containing protein [Candidatus Cryptobacteroides sp.]
MKKSVICAIFTVLATITTFAQSGESIYKKYSGGKGVSAVYISPAMFRMIGTLPDLEIDDIDVNLSGIIQTLNGLYIIESENKSIGTALLEDVEKFVGSKKYELMMEVKSDDETVRIYTAGSENTVEGFVMLAEEDSEVVFISLDGTMPRKELEKILAKAIRTK